MSTKVKLVIKKKGIKVNKGKTEVKKNTEDKIFTDISKRLTKDLSVKEKKSGGIFFTPISITKDLIKYIPTSGKKSIKILEPSCGSGEFINAILNMGLKNVKQIDGIELNSKIFTEVSKEFSMNDIVSIINKDYLAGTKLGPKYDVIIGNPPYYVMKASDVIYPLNDEFSKYYSGRPNVYILFIIKALMELEENGVLIFLIPKSFLNSAYYNALRGFIFVKYTVLDIIDYSDRDDFLETKQQTIGIIIQRKKPIGNVNDKFCVKRVDTYVFNTEKNISRLRELWKGTTSFSEYGFVARTGSVVWNQHKSKMTADSSSPVLVYNSNVTSGEFKTVKFNTAGKEQYIKDMYDKCYNEKSEVIVINRGNGNTKYNFYCALIDGTKLGKFCVENHLNVMTKEGIGNVGGIGGPFNVSVKDVYKSLQDPRTQEFLDIFIGNGGLSATEINVMLPFYLDSAIDSDSGSVSGSDKDSE